MSLPPRPLMQLVEQQTGVPSYTAKEIAEQYRHKDGFFVDLSERHGTANITVYRYPDNTLTATYREVNR